MKRIIICTLLVVAMCLGLTSCEKEEPWKSDFLNSLESETELDAKESGEQAQEGTAESVEVSSIPESYELSWEFGEIYTLQTWGEDLLVVSSNDQKTLITRLDIMDGMVLAQKTVTSQYAYGMLFDVVGDFVRMYEYSTQTWTWLDKNLQITEQYTFEEISEQQPKMDNKGDYIYYIDTSYNLVQLDRRSGVYTLLDSGFDLGTNIYLEQIICDGRIASVSGYMEAKEALQIHYVDTMTGELLKVHDRYLDISGDDTYYSAPVYDEGTQLIVGTYDSDRVSEFVFDDINEYNYFFELTEDRILATIGGPDNDLGRLSLYSMETGEKLAFCDIHLEQDEWGMYCYPWAMAYVDNSESIAYVLMGDSSTIYVWNTLASPCEDETVYLEEYLSWDTTDGARLLELRRKAYKLSSSHGVLIYIGDLSAVDFYGYTAERIYKIRAIERGLKILEDALSAYPKGFFEQLGQSRRGKLTIHLVDTLYPDGSDSLETTTGLYNYDNTSQAIVLSLSALNEIEDLIYHEMSHAIDMKLYDSDYQYWTDEAWNALNPEGFLYDNSYTKNSESFDGNYVWGTGGETYFVDMYSKSFPTEDRARLMEYAMGEYPGTKCFESEMIRAKLAHRAKAIRDNFDTTGWPEVTTWERPLITD